MADVEVAGRDNDPDTECRGTCRGYSGLSWTEWVLKILLALLLKDDNISASEK
jgi:hypothetical protein